MNSNVRAAADPDATVTAGPEGPNGRTEVTNRHQEAKPRRPPPTPLASGGVSAPGIVDER